MSRASELGVMSSLSRGMGQPINSDIMTSTTSQTMRTATSLAKQLTEGLKNLRGGGGGNSKQPSKRKLSCQTENKIKKPKKMKIDDTKASDPERRKKQEEAWKLILQKQDHRQSLVDHYRDLRRPNPSERKGWEALSPEAKNTSDTYLRFLHKRAINKVKAVVSNWREIICQNPCCKDKFCNEMCCVFKQDKKLASADWDERHDHLENSLSSLGREVTQWKFGINWECRNITYKFMLEIANEARWRANEEMIAENWRKNFDWIKEEMGFKLKAEGSSFRDIEWAEDNLRRAERQEMARLAEHERLLQIKQGSAIIDSSEEDTANDSDEDSEDDDFPHLFGNIPTPPQTPTESPSMEYLDTNQSKGLLELTQGLMTPPLSPISESEESLFDPEIRYHEPGQSFITTNPAAINRKDDRFIKALINNLSDHLIHYQQYTDENFNCAFETANPASRRLSPSNHCSWKKHEMADCVKSLLPLVDRPVPDLRLTDPAGKSYFLEEVLPVMDRYCALHIDARDAAQERMEDWYYKNEDISDEEYKALKDHFRQWHTEFGRKDEIIALQERLTQLEFANQIQDEIDFEHQDLDKPRSDENDGNDSNDTVTRHGTDETTDLDTARALVSSNDQLLKSLLIEMKMEFRDMVQTQTGADDARKDEDGKYKMDVGIASKFEATLLRLKKKLWFEGLTSRDWELYEGREGEGKKYSVEITGWLVRDWKCLLKEEERSERRRGLTRARLMAAASRCSWM